jgi:hypothetical protein
MEMNTSGRYLEIEGTEGNLKNVDMVYDLKTNRVMGTSSPAGGLCTIRSGWVLMSIITMIVKEVCSDCIVSQVCSASCEDYYTVYGAVKGWLSGCTYKVSEEEFIRELNVIKNTLLVE